MVTWLVCILLWIFLPRNVVPRKTSTVKVCVIGDMINKGPLNYLWFYYNLNVIDTESSIYICIYMKINSLESIMKDISIYVDSQYVDDKYAMKINNWYT